MLKYIVLNVLMYSQAYHKLGELFLKTTEIILNLSKNFMRGVTKTRWISTEVKFEGVGWGKWEKKSEVHRKYTSTQRICHNIKD